MAIAPMSGVTDEAFRLMFLKYARPSVFWTEFVSVDGLFSKGRDYCLKTLSFDKGEHPIVAQIFGADPAQFERAAKELVGLGFDGIDINMGCPDKDIEKRGGGAALIKNPELAKEIIRATIRGAQVGRKKIPVSVKTRIGYDKNEIDKWIPALLKENIAALTVHFRTRNETYAKKAHWELARDIVKLRNQYAPKTLILGNGDVKSFSEAKKLAEKNGLDGVMIGRAVVGDPWFFLASPKSADGGGAGRLPTLSERLNAIIEHAEIFCALGREKQFETLKKHFHAYTKGFNGAKSLREQLMKVKNAAETRRVIENFLNKKSL